MEDVDVVVVGAGPVGLLSAIELALGGLRVLVLERLACPSQTIKALGVGPLGSEALQRRGMAAALDAEEERNLEAMEQAGMNMRGRLSKNSGHFAGLFLVRTDAQTEPDRRMRFVNQQGLEAVLGARALSLGIEVRRGCDVTGFVQRPDGVDVDWTSPTGAGRVRCAYLVGCDGGRSSIRKMAGFEFPGTPPTMTMYQAIVDIDHPRTPRVRRLAPHAGRRVRLRTLSQALVHAGLQRAAQGSAGARHARGDRDCHPPDQRRGRARERDRSRKPVDRQHAARRHLPQRARASGRRCCAYPFAVRRPRSQPRACRCREPRLEARRDRPWRDAREPARHLHRRAAPRGGSRSGEHPRPGGHHAARPAIGRDAGSHGEPPAARHRQPAHRRDDPGPGHALRFRIGSEPGRPADR